MTLGPSEKAILNDTLVEVSALPKTLAYRQNTGMGWQGRRLRVQVGTTITVKPGMMILADARPVHFGLVGSGDIAGASDGRPFQIETKTLTGPQREQQRNFETAWVKAGGIYILARSVEDTLRVLG